MKECRDSKNIMLNQLMYRMDDDEYVQIRINMPYDVNMPVETNDQAIIKCQIRTLEKFININKFRVDEIKYDHDLYDMVISIYGELENRNND